MPESRRLGLLPTLAVAAYLFVAFALWAVSSPLMGVPDEPAHTIKAASIWQGQLRGQEGEVEAGAGMGGDDDSVSVDWVDVPEAYASAHALPGCYAFMPEVPATCAPDLEDSGRIVEASTTAGPYPPLFYAVVGWPSRVIQNDSGAYLMRLSSAALGALLVAFALRSLSRIVPVSLAVVAFVVALTPMVPFLVGSINPAGLEIAAALLWWSSALALVTTWTPGEKLDRGLVVEFLVGFAVLANTRSLGLMFAALALVVVLAFAGARRSAAVVRDRRAWGLAGALALIGAPAAAWVLANGHLSSVPGSPLPPGSRPLLVLGGVTDDFLREMVAVFGWKDTGPVTPVVMAWMAAALMLLGIAVLLSSNRQRMVVVIATLATIGLPFLLQLGTIERDGIAWQGRYLLPFAVGVPMLAVVAVAPKLSELREGFRASASLIALLCGLGLVVAQYTWLHRTTVGSGTGGLNPFSWTGWNPPVPAGLLLLLTAAVALVPVGFVIIRLGPAGEVLGVDPVVARPRSAVGGREGGASPEVETSGHLGADLEAAGGRGGGGVEDVDDSGGVEE